jgi:hypothetical protein
VSVAQADDQQAMSWVQPALRARAAQDRLDELQQQVEAEYERRDRAIREAIDGGAKMKPLAQALGVTRTTIYRVLGTV